MKEEKLNIFSNSIAGSAIIMKATFLAIGIMALMLMLSKIKWLLYI